KKFCALGAPLGGPPPRGGSSLRTPGMSEPGGASESRDSSSPEMDESSSEARDPTTELLASIACRWVLSHDNVCSTIPGFRNQRQARCNLRDAADPPMLPADADWLRPLFRK